MTDYISRINSRQKAPSISSFNVSTIYTNIIHSSGLRELINICFKAGLGESVAVENYKARYVFVKGITTLHVTKLS